MPPYPAGGLPQPPDPCLFFLVHVIPLHQKFLDPRLPTRYLLPAQIRLIYKLFKEGIFLLRGTHLERHSLVRILLRVENDLSTVAVPTGSRNKRMIAEENVRYIFS
jgi:hypothetical protein